MKRLPLILALTGGLLAGAAHAQTIVADPWVRATVPQQKVTGAFFTITARENARLVEARSPAAGVVEIHEMAIEKGVMRMRAVPGLDLPAGKPVALKPGGGYHVMLTELKGQLEEGDTVPLTLVIEHRDKKRESVQVQAVVKSLTAAPAGVHGH